MPSSKPPANVYVSLALLRANRELSLLHREITGYEFQDADNEPQEYDFLIDAPCEKITDAQRLSQEGNDTEEISDFNTLFLDSFNPALCAKYPPHYERLIDPLWVVILEAAKDEVKFSLLCYKKSASIEEIRPFSIFHRISSNTNTTDYLFSMTHYFTGGYESIPKRDPKEKYKPFYIAVGSNPNFLDAKSSDPNFPDPKMFFEGVCLEREFVDEIDKIVSGLGSDLARANEYDVIMRLICETSDTISEGFDDSLSLKQMIRIEEQCLRFILEDSFRLKFIRYIVWLRMMAHLLDRKWEEYWYFPVADLTSRNLHGVTIALPDRMDENYFYTLNAQLPKLFSHRSAIRFAQQKAKEIQLATELVLHRDIIHYFNNAVAGLAKTNQLITDALERLGASPSELTYSLLQDSTFNILSFYKEIRRRTISDQDQLYKEPSSTNGIGLEEFLRTVHIHALLVQGEISAAITDRSDIYAIQRSIKTAVRYCINLYYHIMKKSSDRHIGFETLKEEQSRPLYELVFPYEKGDSFYSQVGIDIPINISSSVSLGTCLQLYTALSEVFVNSIKYPRNEYRRNVFCKLLDYEDRYTLFIITTNQNLPDNDLINEFLGEAFLTDKLPTEGEGMIVISESLKRISPDVQYKVMSSAEGLYGYYREDPDGVEHKYFCSAIVLPKNTGLLETAEQSKG